MGIWDTGIPARGFGAPGPWLQFFQPPSPQGTRLFPDKLSWSFPRPLFWLAHPSGALGRNGAPPPHFRVCKVCPSLPPPISSRLKPAPPLEQPGDCGRHPSPSAPLLLSGLGGGSGGRAPRAGVPRSLCRKARVWGLEDAERLEGGGGGWVRGRRRECRRQAPRRHIPLGSHSAPKCPFPRPAAAERRGCGSSRADGGICYRRPSRGEGQTWRVRRIPNFAGVWLQFTD